MCQLFDKNVTKVNANLGWEQEYFLIDRSFYEQRLDLILAGKVNLGPFVKTFALDEINDIFEKVHNREILQRPILIP